MQIFCFSICSFHFIHQLDSFKHSFYDQNFVFISLIYQILINVSFLTEIYSFYCYLINFNVASCIMLQQHCPCLYKINAFLSRYSKVICYNLQLSGCFASFAKQKVNVLDTKHVRIMAVATNSCKQVVMFSHIQRKETCRLFLVQSVLLNFR